MSDIKVEVGRMEYRSDNGTLLTAVEREDCRFMVPPTEQTYSVRVMPITTPDDAVVHDLVNLIGGLSYEGAMDIAARIARGLAAVVDAVLLGREQSRARGMAA